MSSAGKTKSDLNPYGGRLESFLSLCWIKDYLRMSNRTDLWLNKIDFLIFSYA